jgi:hypothetical protein
LVSHVSIDVANRHDVSVHGCLMRVDGTLIPHTDGPDAQSLDVVPRFFLGRRGRGVDAEHESGAEGRGAGFKKASAARTLGRILRRQHSRLARYI